MNAPVAIATAAVSLVGAYTTAFTGSPSIVATVGQVSVPTASSTRISGGRRDGSTPASRTRSSSYVVAPNVRLSQHCTMNDVCCDATDAPGEPGGHVVHRLHVRVRALVELGPVELEVEDVPEREAAADRRDAVALDERHERARRRGS